MKSLDSSSGDIITTNSNSSNNGSNRINSNNSSNSIVVLWNTRNACSDIEGLTECLGSNNINGNSGNSNNNISCEDTEDELAENNENNNNSCNSSRIMKLHGQRTGNRKKREETNGARQFASTSPPCRIPHDIIPVDNRGNDSNNDCWGQVYAEDTMEGVFGSDGAQHGISSSNGGDAGEDAGVMTPILVENVDWDINSDSSNSSKNSNSVEAVEDQLTKRGYLSGDGRQQSPLSKLCLPIDRPWWQVKNNDRIVVETLTVLLYT